MLQPCFSSDKESAGQLRAHTLTVTYIHTWKPGIPYPKSSKPISGTHLVIFSRSVLSTDHTTIVCLCYQVAKKQLFVGDRDGAWSVDMYAHEAPHGLGQFQELEE